VSLQRADLDADVLITEQDQKDFEWACSINPNPFKTPRRVISGPRMVWQLRNIASDHRVITPYQRDAVMEQDEIEKRARKIADRSRGISQDWLLRKQGEV